MATVKRVCYHRYLVRQSLIIVR